MHTWFYTIMFWRSVRQNCIEYTELANIEYFANFFFQVTGMRFLLAFDTAYTDIKSKKFLEISQRLEAGLLKALQNSSDLNVTAVKVVAIREGSIVADVEVFIDDQQTTPQQIQETLVNATNNNELDSLNPDPNFQANVTGICYKLFTCSEKLYI